MRWRRRPWIRPCGRVAAAVQIDLSYGNSKEIKGDHRKNLRRRGPKESMRKPHWVVTACSQDGSKGLAACDDSSVGLLRPLVRPWLGDQRPQKHNDDHSKRWKGESGLKAKETW